MCRASVLLVLALLAACDRPRVLVICHNANCAEPTDPANDDTLEALRESLALEYGGRPAIDGIEVDSFWVGADATCVFAHDLDEPRTTPMQAAATEIAAHLAKPGPLTYAEDAAFHVFIELMSHVAKPKSERHTPEQLTLHARCAWDVYTTIAAAAVANGRNVVVVFGAFNPDLLRVVIATEPAATPLDHRFEAFYGIPAPLDSETQPLSDYRGIPLDLVEMHPQWIHDAQHEGVLTSGLDLGFWMFSATTETFQAIEQYQPVVINTSEATLLRRWLEY